MLKTNNPQLEQVWIVVTYANQIPICSRRINIKKEPSLSITHVSSHLIIYTLLLPQPCKYNLALRDQFWYVTGWRSKLSWLPFAILGLLLDEGYWGLIMGEGRAVGGGQEESRKP